MLVLLISTLFPMQTSLQTSLKMISKNLTHTLTGGLGESVSLSRLHVFSVSWSKYILDFFLTSYIEIKIKKNLHFCFRIPISNFSLGANLGTIQNLILERFLIFNFFDEISVDWRKIPIILRELFCTPKKKSLCKSKLNSLLRDRPPA